MKRILKALYLSLLIAMLAPIDSMAQSGWYSPSVTTNELNTVFFLDSLNGWVGGNLNGNVNAGVIEKTTDGGVTWFSQSLPATETIMRITFLSPNIGFAVDIDGTIFKTTNSGTTWLPKRSGVTLFSILFLNNQNGWACGGDTVLSTSDQGETWIAHHVSETTSVPTNLNDIYFKNSQDGWVVGQNGGFYRSTDGGYNWISESAPISMGTYVGICFPTISRGIVVGDGQIMLSTDAGGSWKSVYNSGGSQLNSVSFPDSLIGWIAGSDKIVKTTDGGFSWNEQPWQPYRYLMAVHSSDRFHAWVVGDQLILKTTNGGYAGAVQIPELMLPLNGATEQLTSLGMSWNSIPNAIQYYIQVATDSQFIHLVFNDSTYATSWRISPLQLNTDYFWRISAATYAGRSDWSVAWKFKTLASFPDSIWFPLSIGTKWFYNDYKNKGYIVREITDTTAIGDRIVSVNYFYRNSSNNKNQIEYWLYKDGNLYIDYYEHNSSGFFPKYISSLTNDSTSGDLFTQIDWQLIQETYFSTNYNCQEWIQWHHSMSGQDNTVEVIAPGIGLTKYIYYYGTSPFSIDSLYIIGYIKGGVLIGDSTSKILSVDEFHQKPSSYILQQNYPNPFNPNTTISFDLPSKSFVSLKVFDLMGREVATIISEKMSAGTYSRQWNAVNMSSGIYFYRLQAGSYTQTKKLVLLK
jgi:photosystem II stability/assembly factor-like uncharacterized protein